MKSKLNLLYLSLIVLVVGGCSGLNPNVGTLTADEAYKRGDCARALDIYEPRAAEGKPWAQARMGIVYFEGKCKPGDYEIAMMWLKKAAEYEATTDWEKGKTHSTGPAGYFNTRTSSAIASSYIALMYMEGLGIEKNPVTAWLWANRAVAMTAYDMDKPRFEKLRTQIENQMSPEELQQAKGLSETWSPKN